MRFEDYRCVREGETANGKGKGKGEKALKLTTSSQRLSSESAQ